MKTILLLTIFGVVTLGIASEMETLKEPLSEKGGVVLQTYVKVGMTGTYIRTVKHDGHLFILAQSYGGAVSVINHPDCPKCKKP